MSRLQHGQGAVQCTAGNGAGRAAGAASSFEMSIARPLQEHALGVLAILRDPRPNLLQHLAAAGGIAVALLVRGLLDPVLDDRQPLSILFGAVALTVWLSGYKPALTAMVLGYLGADYFFTEPRGQVAISTDQQLMSLIFYLSSCAIVIAFGESLRRAHDRLSGYARQLESQRTELEKADRAKDQFLAVLSHELRSPLTAVNNVAELLQRKSGAYPDLKDVSRILCAQTRHLTRLVDDLLDLARIRTGRIHLRRETLSLKELLTTTVDSLRPACQAASLSLDCQLPDKTLMVLGDFARLSQVFMNILTNAIRYTRAGGCITVRLAAENGHAVARVRDTGIGIPKDMLERIFELFEQTDIALEQSRSGLGIGLTLVRKIVHLHGGTVAAHSAGPGTGSEFVVRLPLLG
jgi:signal transduction histidine kinase